MVMVVIIFIFILVILFLVSDRHYVYGYAMMLMRMVPIIQCIVMVVNSLMLLGIIIMIVFMIADQCECNAYMVWGPMPFGVALASSTASTVC